MDFWWFSSILIILKPIFDLFKAILAILVISSDFGHFETNFWSFLIISRQFLEDFWWFPPFLVILKPIFEHFMTISGDFLHFGDLKPFFWSFQVVISSDFGHFETNFWSFQIISRQFLENFWYSFSRGRLGIYFELVKMAARATAQHLTCHGRLVVRLFVDCQQHSTSPTKANLKKKRGRQLQMELDHLHCRMNDEMLADESASRRRGVQFFIAANTPAESAVKLTNKK